MLANGDLMNFDKTRIAYLAHAWDAMTITRARAEMERDARKVLAKKAIYADVEQLTGVPWWLVAVIDMREGGIEFLGTRHLHNGDRLSDYTKNVPAGRPKVGHPPPFRWRESAIDSIKYQGLDKVARWTIERALHVLEGYNGFKYANAGRPTPYNWSCCSIYDPPTGPGGKVCVDHGPIEDVVDKQYGTAPFLRVLAELDRTIVFAREAAAPTVIVKPAAAGKAAAGGAIVVAGAAAGKAAADAGLGGASIMAIVIAAIVLGAVIWFLVSRSKTT